MDWRDVKPSFRHRVRRAKLTEGQVREILRLRPDVPWAQMGPQAKAVGRQYGVSKYAIVCIWQRKTWAWVEMDR